MERRGLLLAIASAAVADQAAAQQQNTIALGNAQLQEKRQWLVKQGVASHV